MSTTTGHARLKRTILLRTGGLMLLLTLGILVASSLFVVGEQRVDEKQQALEMARFLSDQALRLNLWGNPTDLVAFFSQIKRFHFTFEHVVVEQNGQIVFHTMPAELPHQLLSKHDEVTETGVVQLVRNPRGTAIYDAAVAVPSENAVVHVGVARGPIGEHTRATLRSIAAGSSLALVLGFALSWMLAVLTTREVAVAETAVRESEERFRLLFEQAPDSIVLLDVSKDGPPTIVAANEATCQMHGYTRDEIIGSPITMLDAPEDQKLVKERVQKILEGDTVTFEVEHVRKDGSSFPVEVIARLTEFDGKPAIQAIDRDISDRKKAEEEKQALEAQLMQAQKMQAIGRLAGGIAHDINNVLGTVMGSTSLLKEEIDENHPHWSDLERIDLACQRGRDVTRNFLGYARKGAYIREVFDANRLVEETEHLLEATIPKKIVIETDPGPAGAVINGDRSLIAQAVMNLCINAVDAMDGEGTLRIESAPVTLDEDQARSTPQLEAGRYVRLSVHDTGAGMDDETIAKVFEPFFTTKPKGKGTGLGLSMVHGTAISHGGAVHIESEPGQGTSIHLYLPAADGDAAATVEVAGKVETAPVKTGRILLVEDEKLLRSVGRQMLEKLGHTVIEAENGVRAVDTFQRDGSDIDLVILDLVMPEMDGAEAFHELKKMAPKVKVLISSGFIDDEVVEELLDDGAAGFIEKPYDMNSLGEAVARALGGPRRSVENNLG